MTVVLDKGAERIGFPCPTLGAALALADKLAAIYKTGWTRSRDGRTIYIWADVGGSR